MVFHPIYTWESSFVEEKCTLAVHVGFLPLHYLKEEKKTPQTRRKNLKLEGRGAVQLGGWGVFANFLPAHAAGADTATELGVAIAREETNKTNWKATCKETLSEVNCTRVCATRAMVRLGTV